MNYAFQFSGLPRLNGTTVFDYSRFGLGLNEAALNESTGFGAASGSLASQFFTIGFCPGGTTTAGWRLSGAADFDCDSALDTSPFSSDTNNDTVLTNFSPFVDWDNILFAGGAIGQLGSPTLPASTEDPEPTLSELVSTRDRIQELLASPPQSPVGQAGGEPEPPSGGPGSGPGAAEVPVLSRLRARRAAARARGERQLPPLARRPRALAARVGATWPPPRRALRAAEEGAARTALHALRLAQRRSHAQWQRREQ